MSRPGPHSGAMLDAMNIKAPGLIRLMLEWRAPWEFGAALASWPLLQKAARGDGHAVLVFPGLAASDVSTKPMRSFLANLGYRTHGWQQGTNLGPKPGVVEAAAARLEDLAQRSGGKVSLIGWSLGGIYARELAKQRPELVRSVQTLGTPFAGPPTATNAWRLFQLASGGIKVSHDLHRSLRRSPPPPTSSIFSRTDGVVAWQCSVQPHDEAHGPIENIEVHASHFGIGLNPLSWYALADRLAQTENNWKPFEAPALARAFYRHYQ